MVEHKNTNQKEQDIQQLQTAELRSVIEGTAAAEAVLQATDKITKMDQTPISSSNAAMKFIQSKKPGDQITIQVNVISEQCRIMSHTSISRAGCNGSRRETFEFPLILPLLLPSVYHCW